MQLLIYSLLYAAYAAANTLAMAAVKDAVRQLSAADRGVAVGRLTLGSVLYGAALLVLFVLLRYGEASTVFPIAIGCAVLATHVAGAHFYKERFTANKLLGTTLIVAGIALIHVGAAPA